MKNYLGINLLKVEWYKK